MEEMTLRVPVAVKAKVTEDLKAYSCTRVCSEVGTQ